MRISIADWGNFDQVLKVAQKYHIGLEVQEFTVPANLDNPDTLVGMINDNSKSLPILGMHGPYAELVPASWDPLIRQVVRTRFQRSYELARSIGAGHLILHSGFIPKTYHLEKWIQNSYDFWSDFLKDKPDPGLIHIENVYEDDFSPLIELIDRVNQLFHEERLSACLDIGHVNANSSRTFEDWIAGLGVRIRYVHVSNNGGILDDHWRLDMGKIDVDHVLRLLKDHAPDSIWTVETTLADIEPSVFWLQEHGHLPV